MDLWLTEGSEHYAQGDKAKMDVFVACMHEYIKACHDTNNGEATGHAMQDIMARVRRASGEATGAESEIQGYEEPNEPPPVNAVDDE